MILFSEAKEAPHRFYNVSGTHGDQHVALGKIFVQIVFDFRKGWEIFAGRCRVLQCAPGYLWRRCRAYQFLWLRKYRREPHGLARERAAAKSSSSACSGRGMRLEDAPQCSVRTVFSGFHRCTGFRLDDAHNRRSPLLRGMYLYTGNGGRFRGRWQAFVDGAFSGSCSSSASAMAARALETL